MFFFPNKDWGLLFWFLQQAVAGHCISSLHHDLLLCPLSSRTAWYRKSGEKETLLSVIVNISAVWAWRKNKICVKMSHGVKGRQQQTWSCGLGVTFTDRMCFWVCSPLFQGGLRHTKLIPSKVIMSQHIQTIMWPLSRATKQNTPKRLYTSRN